MKDLKQEGYIGLCEAVRHYSITSEVPFINYAAFWIRRTMQRYVDNCSSLIRIPVHVREWTFKYKKIVREYKKTHGKEPTKEELGNLLGVSVSKLENILECMRKGNVRSFSEQVGGDDEDITISDTIASEQDLEEDAIKKIDSEAMRKILWAAVDELPDYLPQVIRYRYQEEMTLKEVGETMGFSMERARDDQAKALRYLRKSNTSRQFKRYFEQYLSAGPICHVGVTTFNRTWTSAVELEALRRIEPKKYIGSSQQQEFDREHVEQL